MLQATKSLIKTLKNNYSQENEVVFDGNAVSGGELL